MSTDSDVKRWQFGDIPADYMYRGFVLASDYDALAAERDALRKALEVVLDDLMYKDHKRVIDFANAALRGEKPCDE